MSMHRAADVAVHFGVTEATVLQWSRMRGFPLSAKKRVGNRVYWDLPKIIEWNRSRRQSQRKEWEEKIASYERVD